MASETSVMPARRRPSRLTRRVLLASLLVCLGVFFVVGSAPADEPDDSWAYDLAGEVMSPFCPGRTLASCPSPNAAELIQWIILQEKAGATREEVEEQLYARYGDVIRSAPKPEGWGLAAYVIPVVAALLGIGLVAWVLRRLSRRDGESASPPSVPVGTAAAAGAPPVDDEIARLVDRELEEI
jgi:cytochrome c-type biogenesis protein CcmH/NrfF